MRNLGLEDVERLSLGFIFAPSRILVSCTGHGVLATITQEEEGILMSYSVCYEPDIPSIFDVNLGYYPRVFLPWDIIALAFSKTFPNLPVKEVRGLKINGNTDMRCQYERSLLNGRILTQFEKAF